MYFIQIKHRWFITLTLGCQRLSNYTVVKKIHYLNPEVVYDNSSIWTYNNYHWIILFVFAVCIYISSLMVQSVVFLLFMHGIDKR